MARVCEDDDACVEYRSNVLWNDKGKTTSPCVNCRRGAVRMTNRYKPDVDDIGVYACTRCGKVVSKPNGMCIACSAHDREISKPVICKGCGKNIKNSPGRRKGEVEFCAVCELKRDVHGKRKYDAEKAREYRERQRAKKMVDRVRGDE